LIASLVGGGCRGEPDCDLGPPLQEITAPEVGEYVAVSVPSALESTSEVVISIDGDLVTIEYENADGPQHAVYRMVDEPPADE
jgi:hypothetical protein